MPKPEDMFRIAPLMILLFFCTTVLAQEQQDSAKKKTVIDTAAIYKDLEANLKDLFGDIAPKSYVELSVGVSNQVFNLHNNFLNSTQGEGKMIYKPGITYYHKSGLSLGVNAYAANFDQFKIYQYAVTPSYDLSTSKTISFGISYTHYFSTGDSLIKQNVPYENEIYAYLSLKKGWLNPGINIGWANGKFRKSTYIDSIFLPRLGRKIAVKRWIPVDTKLNDFSASVTFSHEFDFSRIFGKSDMITLVPMLMFNAGSFSQTSSADIQNEQIKLFVNRLSTRRDRLYSSQFKLQSISFMTSLDYSAGKFTVSPTWLLDYYLGETSSSRFNNIFAVNISYSF